MQEALFLSPEPDREWDLARQMGVTHATTPLPGEGRWRGDYNEPETDDAKPWGFERLLHLERRFADAGIDLVAIEDVFPPLEAVRRGTDRERGVEIMRTLVENMGAVGIPILCYGWSPAFAWFRTSVSVRTRGGSLTTGYDRELVADAPPPGNVAITEAELWENLEYFLERVGPVAEEAGVTLALHPDDPPRSPVRGVSRILTSPGAFERAMDLYESEANAITFCQGNFAAMGADIPATIRRFGDDVRYVHFRDVRGTADRFVETWHDDGPTDMVAAMRAYREIGFEGPMRPDHVPTMAGEDNDDPGYETDGKLFVIGYMRGLRQATDGIAE